MPATLKSRFPQVVLQMNPLVDAAIKAGCELVAESARARVHVSSEGEGESGGHLRDRIWVREGREWGERVQSTYYVVAGGGEVYWGHFEEFGTVDTPAHPFLVPALEANKMEIVALCNAALKAL